MDENQLNNIKRKISAFFSDKNLSPNVRMNNSLRYLAKYRSLQIGNTIIQKYGTKVLGGPFKGMNFLDSVSEGCYAPKLLGLYEAELHSYIDEIVEKKPDVIINIGCAEGYYAVGLKMLLPDTEVYAFDIDPDAKKKCKQLSEMNNVNININDEFKSEILKDFNTKDVVIFCDIEGDEVKLINSHNLDLYKNSEICMELHHNGIDHNKDIIPNILDKTHTTNLIWQKGKNFEVPELISNISHLDILLSAWEWRSYPTPWLIAKPF